MHREITGSIPENPPNQDKTPVGWKIGTTKITHLELSGWFLGLWSAGNHMASSDLPVYTPVSLAIPYPGRPQKSCDHRYRETRKMTSRAIQEVMVTALDSQETALADPRTA